MFDRTNNGAVQYFHSLDHGLEFFSKAGSAFSKRSPYYSNPESCLSLFQRSWIVDPLLSFKLLLWLRDFRNGGAGNRSGFRETLIWLATQEDGQDWIRSNIHLIPFYGRFDDLRSLYDTPLEQAALELWAQEIHSCNRLAAKWASRKDKKLRAYMKLSPKAYRKLLVMNTQVVETPMCKRQWAEIQYPTVPSVAMARYSKAFKRHDKERFSTFKQKVVKGEAKINTQALFPHDCSRTVWNGDKDLANTQFEEMIRKDVITSPSNTMFVADVSGSMHTAVSGSISAKDIAISLALYCCRKINPESSFYRHFMLFSQEGRLYSWHREFNFAEVFERVSQEGWIGNTNISKALETLLSYAQMYKIHPKDMIQHLVIVSDMQFDIATEPGMTPVEQVMQKWENAGYKRPRIIYWNLVPYGGQPATSKDPNIALVSGFSPAILKNSFEHVPPKDVMLQTIAKYEVQDPRRASV